MDLDYGLIDADEHFYEPHDCFTRYIEPRYRDRVVHRVPGDDGIGRVYVGDRRLWFASVWPSDYGTEPGALQDYYEGRAERDAVIEEPIDPRDHPEFLERPARLELMDRQGVEATTMLPTLGVIVENDLLDDVEALYANMRAFNRWVAEDWGFAADGRIFATPWLSLADPELALAEARRVVDAGARMVYLKPAPAVGRTPADTVFDGFWRTLEEAGVSVALHIGDAGAVYTEHLSPMWGEPAHVQLHKMSTFQRYLCLMERPIMDTVASMILNNLFGRFPGLRVASIENGSLWVSHLLRVMDKTHRDNFRRPSRFGAIDGPPSEIFRRHVWVSPFFEEDVAGLAGLIGAERVLFGSDYPHPEGLRSPADYLAKLDGLPPGQVRRIMRDNAAELLGTA